MGCHALLQGIFLTQGSNPRLLTSPALAGRSLPLMPPGKSIYFSTKIFPSKGSHRHPLPFICVCLDSVHVSRLLRAALLIQLPASRVPHARPTHPQTSLPSPPGCSPLDCRSSPVPTNVFPGSFSDFILRNPGHNTRSRAAMDPETQTGVCLQTDRAGMWARYQNLPRELILLPLTHTQVTSVLLEVYFSIYFKIHILPQGAPST